MQPGSEASRTTAGPSGGSGLATDAHGGTIARDTGVRDGQVVGLAGPTDVSDPTRLEQQLGSYLMFSLASV